MARKTRTVTGAQAPASAKANDVFVCSHLHRGLLFDMPDGSRVRIGGVNDALRGKAKGIIATGGGVYTCISADAWAYISKTYAELDPIKHGLIYAEESASRAKAAIREKEELRDGFEPVDPEKSKKTQPKTDGD